MPAKSKYDPKFCEELVSHMSQGLSFESFGGVAKVGRATLYEWLEKHEEFKEAKELAETCCLLWWEKLAVEHVVQYSEGASINTGVFVFNMKNRFNWRDTKNIDVDGKLTLEQLVLGSYGGNNDKNNGPSK